ncbi:DUF5344 family protein [Oceanobacillus timonensis]|uniref:DUF5344 family protein n=1 Tax=Oceanobacillus timonensis TaxID=1926285 RepID=UPI0009BC4475|nr:DUF5344 family protein [Oceanobacillus timonensis]
MGEIKLVRSQVEEKYQQIASTVSQIDIQESQSVDMIDTQKEIEMAEKMQDIAVQWQKIMESYQRVVNQHLGLSEEALDSLEERERQAAKGIEMLK